MESPLILEFEKSFKSIKIEGRFEFIKGFNIILGRSGSGKTTTLRIMAGLEKPDKGFMKCCEEVFFDTEKDIFLPPQKRKVGIVFQEDNLFPNMTVRENIEFALRKGNGKVNLEKLLEKFGLNGLEDRYPHELSGGQRQRVAILRALVYFPRAILMDEPFSSLDFKIKLEIMKFLKGLSLDIPVVIVTHDPFEASFLGEKIFIMEEGRKVAEGGKELIKEFFSEPGF